MKLAPTFPPLLAIVLAACQHAPKSQDFKHPFMQGPNAPVAQNQSPVRKRYTDTCVKLLAAQWQMQTNRIGLDANDEALLQKPVLATFTLLADGSIVNLQFRTSVWPSQNILECARLTFANVKLPPMPADLAAESGGKMPAAFWLARQTR